MALVKVRQTLKMYWSPFSITKTLDRRCLSFLVWLSSYTCESEENIRLSGSDDPLTVGSSVASDPDCLLGASEALLANRPFSAVTMDTDRAQKPLIG